MPQIDFIFDFASPNGYLTHRALSGLVERTGATLNVIPCLLGGIFKATGNQAPMIAFGNIKNKMEYERMEFQRFIAKHGLSDLTFNPHFPVNTLLLMRGAIYAQREGFLDAYLAAGLHHMWEDCKDMSDPDVFAEAMTESGLDGKAILEATQDPDIKAALVKNTEEAVSRGAFGIPTFFVGDEMFFGKERLGQLEEHLAA